MSFAQIREPEKRNPEWERVSREYLKDKCCACCMTTNDLVTHHIKPFHEYPELEMVESNWMPVCETCHRCICHFCNWKLANPNAKTDAASMRRAKLHYLHGEVVGEPLFDAPWHRRGRQPGDDAAGQNKSPDPVSPKISEGEPTCKVTC